MAFKRLVLIPKMCKAKRKAGYSIQANNTDTNTHGREEEKAPKYDSDGR